MKQILGCGQGDNHVLDEHTDMVIKLQLRVSQQESGANIDHQEGGAHHICQPRIGNSDSPKIEKQIEQAWKPHHKNSSICSLKLLRKISPRVSLLLTPFTRTLLTTSLSIIKWAEARGLLNLAHQHIHE